MGSYDWRDDADTIERALARLGWDGPLATAEEALDALQRLAAEHERWWVALYRIAGADPTRAPLHISAGRQEAKLFRRAQKVAHDAITKPSNCCVCGRDDMADARLLVPAEAEVPRCRAATSEGGSEVTYDEIIGGLLDDLAEGHQGPDVPERAREAREALDKLVSAACVGAEEARRLTQAIAEIRVALWALDRDAGAEHRCNPEQTGEGVVTCPGCQRVYVLDLEATEEERQEAAQNV